ncbi:methyltransferase domain-containing protein [Flavobacterium psychrolimnae]|uniref:Class I SAM-dependent methyltransferase n=1 Tax=Flavobacterium psychrolimnae TaxID=249351 RepID=A0A366AZK6_9FLAO|nr:hypothetical protein [Flavobacterium psychrolimnae]RBN50305.1 hypothetical protein DR980_09320 [Flavobacterium psychrolimnae]
MKKYIKIRLIQLFDFAFKNKKQNYLEVKTIALKAQKKSDIERWSVNNSLYENWNQRTALLATFLSETAKIIEFGAGAMYLKQLIKPTQTYVASDIVKRFPETLVFDLNGQLDIDLSLYDTIIFSGVLEYIYDIERLFEKMKKEKINQIILSYCCSDVMKVSREKNGWLSDYTQIQLESIFKKNNYKIVNHQIWEKQTIFNLMFD